jgi:chemotaxis protein MotA
MNFTTILGFGLAVGMMAFSIAQSGGNFQSFYDVAALAVVGGGTLAAVLISVPMKSVRKGPQVFRKAMLTRPMDLEATIETLVRLGEIARRDGLLALESRLATIKDPYIRLGIEMSVDGAPPEAIEGVLRSDSESMVQRHKEGKRMFDQAGRFAPAFGLIGTLLGLITMLGQMSDPGKIASGMAVALVTTLYGAVLANAGCLPIAEKLSSLTRDELLAREVILRGILAIQSGENPRLIRHKLNAFLPPARRQAA